MKEVNKLIFFTINLKINNKRIGGTFYWIIFVFPNVTLIQLIIIDCLFVLLVGSEW
jgi:hypothetical protein